MVPLADFSLPFDQSPLTPPRATSPGLFFELRPRYSIDGVGHKLTRAKPCRIGEGT